VSVSDPNRDWSGVSSPHTSCSQPAKASLTVRAEGAGENIAWVSIGTLSAQQTVDMWMSEEGESWVHWSLSDLTGRLISLGRTAIRP
jgi:hypothetical protein